MVYTLHDSFLKLSPVAHSYVPIDFYCELWGSSPLQAHPLFKGTTESDRQSCMPGMAASRHITLDATIGCDVG